MDGLRPDGPLHLRKDRLIHGSLQVQRTTYLSARRVYQSVHIFITELGLPTYQPGIYEREVHRIALRLAFRSVKLGRTDDPTSNLGRVRNIRVQRNMHC